FCATADARFGPITTLRRDGKVKHIPWKAFKLTDADWERVGQLVEILKDAQRIQQVFSSDQLPTLWRAIPAIERLQTAWEKKVEDPKFSLYAPGIVKALNKIAKYYCDFDKHPVFVLAIFLHPYYKLKYIAQQWGGAEEQAEEMARGNPDAKNWVAEAERIIKEAVSFLLYRLKLRD
ncbi:hypothetical protein SISNIDRAFT_420140, partial [Sistotremastrum niveocremeum HHB9708]